MATKTEEEKMLAGLPYDAHTPEMRAHRLKVKKILHRLNVTEAYTEHFQDIVNELCPNSAKDLYLEPPFYCDYGTHIHAGEKVFVNFGAVILDGGTVTIGAHTLIAPGVHIYTAEHPLDIADRRQWENCRPVKIGEECWIGGHATICPGVTIGDRTVIGAGAVVVRDIPADSLAVGNPARVVRRLNRPKDKGKMERATTVTVYGIKHCDTMKKAFAWLDAHGVSYEFHDYKKAGIAKTKLAAWCRAAGWEKVLNRAGLSFRKLPEAEKRNLTQAKAVALMLANPSMIKRPVLEADGALEIGFSPEAYAARFGGR